MDNKSYEEEYCKRKQDTAKMITLINSLNFDNFEQLLIEHEAKRQDFNFFASRISKMFLPDKITHTNGGFLAEKWAVALDFPIETLKKQDENNWFYIYETRQANNTVFAFRGIIKGNPHCYTISISHNN